MKLFVKYLQDFHPVFKAVSVFFDASGKDFGPFYQPFETTYSKKTDIFSDCMKRCSPFWYRTRLEIIHRKGTHIYPPGDLLK